MRSTFLGVNPTVRSREVLSQDDRFRLEGCDRPFDFRVAELRSVVAEVVELLRSIISYHGQRNRSGTLLVKD